ncbi:uncharacterized protein LOC135172836 [Diachasmimorpha longicaudata]|uniref:uncharacterized protein LOC135172836 n=1 Tax=Diachasmimorpha longicaudata TaxID=58733 RepID=UPI0030B8EF2F
MEITKFDTESSLAVVPRFLRLIQFLTTLLIFSLAIYLTVMSRRYLTDVACILLICLSSSHLFFQGLDIMNHFFGDGVPESPMYIFSLIGMILFAIAGISLIHYVTSYISFWAILMTMILCFIISFLYTIEIIAVLFYWRRKYSAWKKCHPVMMEPMTKTSFTKTCEFPSPNANICKCEITTSVSGQDFLDPTVDITETHGMRKINYARRRQYVDSPCSVPALTIQAVGEVQTDNRLTSLGEAQTANAQMKETIIQTATQDNRQKFKTPQQCFATDTCLCSRILYPQYQIPCSKICPASIVILPGTLRGSCCESCNCSDHLEKSSQQLHQINRIPDNIYEPCQHSALQCNTTSIIVDSNVDRMSGDQEPNAKGSIYGFDMAAKQQEYTNDTSKKTLSSIEKLPFTIFDGNSQEGNKRIISTNTQKIWKIDEQKMCGNKDPDTEKSNGTSSLILKKISEKRYEENEEDYSPLKCLITTTGLKHDPLRMMKTDTESTKTIKIEDQHALIEKKNMNQTQKDLSHSQEFLEKRGNEMNNRNIRVSRTLDKKMKKSKSKTLSSSSSSSSSVVTLSSVVEKKWHNGEDYRKSMIILKHHVDEEINEKLSLDNEREISFRRNSNLLSSDQVKQMSKRVKPLYRQRIISNNGNSIENDDNLRVIEKSDTIARIRSPLLQAPMNSKSKEHSPCTSRTNGPVSMTGSSAGSRHSANNADLSSSRSHIYVEQGGSNETIINKGDTRNAPQYVTDGEVHTIQHAPLIKQSQENIPICYSYTIHPMDWHGEQQLKKFNNSKSQTNSSSASNEVRAADMNIDGLTEMEYELHLSRKKQKNHQISGRALPSELSVVMESLNETNEIVCLHPGRHRTDSSVISCTTNCEDEISQIYGEHVRVDERYRHRKPIEKSGQYGRQMNLQIVCGWDCSHACIHPRLYCPRPDQNNGLHDFRRDEYLYRKHKRASKRNHKMLNICYLL